MSRHSEYQRCNKLNTEYGINNQLEYAGNYIVHDCALLRMHTGCHPRCRVTAGSNDVASRLFSAIPLININMFLSMRIVCMILRCLRGMLDVIDDAESL